MLDIRLIHYCEMFQNRAHQMTNSRTTYSRTIVPKTRPVIRLLVGLIMTFSSFNSFAGCASHRCNSTIKTLYASSRDSGVVFVSLTSPTAALNCQLVENTYLSLKKDHPLFREIYSMLLTAKATEAEVGLRIVENSADCKISYAVFL